jgi:type I site-specific restriction-modification system R (restriction) subunit
MENKTPPSSSGNIADEFNQLGQNLLQALRMAWESDERKKLQQEMETGLNDMVKSLKQAGNEFAQSPAGQNIKTEFDDFRQRVESGEVETKVRSEVLSALQTVNAELKRVMQKQQAENPSSSSAAAAAGGCDDCEP